MVKLYHYTNRNNLESILSEGLIPNSRYESFSNLRENVVYCWFSPDDQKIFSDDDICLEICVSEERCTVAEMDYVSFAMMYKYGGAKYGGKNIPVNLEAAELFIKLYEVTSALISNCEKDNYFTPEVLVKGKIEPENIAIYGLT